jgi:hypothetical protein
MNPFDDIQIEELENFDYISDDDFAELYEDASDFNLNDYINGNYDY